MENAIIKNAQYILDQAKSLGATADVIIDEGSSLSLKVENGKLSEHKVSSAQVFGVRTIKDGKVGTAYSEASDDESLSYMVNESVNNASFSEVEESETILDLQGELRTDDSHFYPDDSTSVDTKIDFILELENELLKNEIVKSVPYNAAGTSEGQRSYFNSSGLSAFSKSRTSFAYAYALAESQGKNAMDGKSQMDRVFSNLNKKEILSKVLNTCTDMLEGLPIKSGKYDVIFSTEMLPAVLGIFMGVFSAKSAKDGVNPWREKLGQQVCSNKLNFVDRPHLKEGFGYELFDSEGVGTKDLVLTEDGRLNSFIHNSSTANHFKTKTTGHAARGAKSSLGVGLHQLTLDAGDASASDLTAGEYFEVTKLDGLHSGANGISGDFSFGASGYLKKDGKVVQVVRGVTVAGNFFDMINAVAAVEDSIRWNDSKSALMPSVRFEALSVSGL